MGARGSRLAAAQALKQHISAAHTFLALSRRKQGFESLGSANKIKGLAAI
jgi:hypothetical protein